MEKPPRKKFFQKKTTFIWWFQKIIVPLHPQTRKRRFIRGGNWVTFLLVLHFGAIAQLVEHRTENPCVTGSNPVGTTKDLQSHNDFWRSFFFYNL